MDPSNASVSFNCDHIGFQNFEMSVLAVIAGRMVTAPGFEGDVSCEEL